jgi:hypothetical protein
MLRFAVLALAVSSLSAVAAEELNLVGKWEGKDKDGKVLSIEFKADHTVVMLEDGKSSLPPEASVKWEIVDGNKSHLDLVMKAGDQEHRVPMLVEAKGANIVIGGPKGDKRAEKMEEADEPVEFTKK